MRLERDNFGIERIDLATLGLEAHGTDHVCPLNQVDCIGQGQAAQASHARRAVDQAQTVLGAEFDRLQACFGQGLLCRYDLAAVADLPHPEQGNIDMRHMGQVTH
ncbi:hypothetical protein D3C84_978820 [compost metagenome]